MPDEDERSKMMAKPYVLNWMQRITLDIDRPPWHQRIFGYKKSTTRWVRFGIKLKGIDPDEFALAFETNGWYDQVALERKETPTPYVVGASQGIQVCEATSTASTPHFESGGHEWYGTAEEQEDE